MLKDAVKGALPFGGGGGSGGKGGAPGVGKGRRMPVQQSVDIAAPIETVYNQWTQFEDWPNFMHRVTRVTQEDDGKVSFATKIWGKTKEFTAQIETQRPDERIKWRVSQGITHTGVVTFHELAPRLTRVLLSMDLEPGGLLEKAARGMRHFKRAARADLHRFKAFIEMTEKETGAWRGVIEDGKLVEEHDPSYDKKRDYADLDVVLEDSDRDDSDKDDEAQENDDKPSAKRTRRQPRKSASARGTSAKSTGQTGRSSAGRGRNGRTASASSSSSGSRGRGASGSSSGRPGSSGSRSASSSSRSGTSRRSPAAKTTSRRQGQSRRSTKS